MHTELIIDMLKAFPQGKSHVRNSEWVCIVDNYNDVRHLGNDAVCH